MKIKLSCDDCTIADLRVDDLMIRYGLQDKIVYFWPVMVKLANEAKGRISLTEDQMQQIASHSKIGSHGLTHGLLTRMPLDIARREIFDSRRILQEKFSQSIDEFCYPRGYANPDIQKLVQEAGYKSARGVTVGYIYESENPYYEQTAVHAGLDRKEYGGKTWLEYARSMLDLARDTPNSVYHVWFHSWELTKNDAWSDFERLLEEIANG